MTSSIFQAFQETTGLFAGDLERLLIGYIVEASNRAFQAGEAKNLHWDLGANGTSSRKLIVALDPATSGLKLFVEVVSELFEGDFHYQVEEIGTVDRTGAPVYLAPLVSAALKRLSAWKPTYENILG